jgi:hypothetical protein
MAHLGSFRKGWESENLARFILYKFSFIAHPSAVADDIGSDFFCTLFETRRESGQDYLVPTNSFAIQIKSNADTFDVSNKLGYLDALEIPFFVGVADQETLRLTMYSGEYLPMLFSLKGLPQKLEIELCEETTIDPTQYYTESSNRSYVLKFPKIAEIESNAEPEELKALVENLGQICSCIHNNIASRKNREYVFAMPAHNPTSVVIFAGPGSVEVFRDNFLKRLAEAFYNLEWVCRNYPRSFNPTEYIIYEELLNKLKECYGNLPDYLTGPYESLAQALVESPDVSIPTSGGTSIMSGYALDLSSGLGSLIDLGSKLSPEGLSRLCDEAQRLAEKENQAD